MDHQLFSRGSPDEDSLRGVRIFLEHCHSPLVSRHWWGGGWRDEEPACLSASNAGEIIAG
jgi:hypothetical protein